MNDIPAPLIRRVGAFAVDYIVISVYLTVAVIVGILVNQVAPEFSTRVFSHPLRAQAIGFLLVTLPVTLYFALFESSTSQATLGKRKLQLRVATLGGAPLSRGRALIRTALKFVPWELAHTCIWQITGAGGSLPPVVTAGLYAVWILVGANFLSVLLDSRRRSLYDLVVGTAVVQVEKAASQHDNDDHD